PARWRATSTAIATSSMPQEPPSMAGYRRLRTLRTSVAGRSSRCPQEPEARSCFACWSWTRVALASMRGRCPSSRRGLDVATRDAGFSLVELTAALTVTLALTAAIFSLTQSSRAASIVQSEAADLQQRTRVVVDTLTRDLIMAGAGPYLPGHSGPLNTSFPPVLPFRRGMMASDPGGTFKSDTITVLYVPTTAAQTPLAPYRDVGS